MDSAAAPPLVVVTSEAVVKRLSVGVLPGLELVVEVTGVEVVEVVEV